MFKVDLRGCVSVAGKESRLWGLATVSFLPRMRGSGWRIPDRRHVRALLDVRRHFGRQLHPEKIRIIRRPARRRGLDHAHMVERALLRIEQGVLAIFLQRRDADRVPLARILDVHRVARRRQLAVLARFAVARPYDVVDFLLRRARRAEPALRQLHAVEVDCMGGARIRNVGALPAGAAFRSPPIGTPRW